MIKDLIKENFKKCLESLVAENKLESQAMSQLDKFTIVRSKNAQFGDFAANIAMLIAREEKKAPRDIAELLVNKLKEITTIFAKVEIAGPGFINLTLNNQSLSTIIPEVLLAGQNYGKSTTEPKKRVLIEFVSANPTGGLHLGHARGAFVGDALVRLFKAAGFEVTSEFYVNDVGNQVETLARTIHKRYRELFGEKITIEKNEYPGAYVIDIAEALKKIHGDKWLHKKEDEWLIPLAQFGVDYNLALIKRSLNNVDIEIDSFYKEHQLHENGSLDKLMKAYEERAMLYEALEAHGTKEKVRREESKAAQFAHLQQGGWFLKTSQFGDDEDRIVRRKDGRFVYLTADLAYHYEKFNRGFDIIIDVLGGDHSGHIGRIKAGMQALGHDPKRLQFSVVQMVRLLRNGQEVRFSKRAGEVASIDDLILEVGKDAARFVFLMRSPSSQFDLDLDILTLENHDNPVFYVQYGHARMATILKKARLEKNLSVNPKDFGVKEQECLNLPEERELILKITELPEVVREAALSLEPHRVIYYCQDLIKSFHGYFTKYRHSEKIISDDELKTKARLALVNALKETIYNALSFLGIEAPDYMQFTEVAEKED